MALEDSSDASYEQELAEANAARLTSVEDRDIVTVFRAEDGSLAFDADGSAVVLLIPSLVPAEKGSWEKAFQLFLRETQQICESNYRIIYVHSAFSSPVWFAWWLTRLRSRVSRAHRKNIKGVTIVHPSIAVRLFFFSMRPVLGINFWAKLHYADRLDELWLDNVLSRVVAQRNIPRILFTYEGKIVQEVEEMRDVARMLGVPISSREESVAGNNENIGQ